MALHPGYLAGRPQFESFLFCRSQYRATRYKVINGFNMLITEAPDKASSIFQNIGWQEFVLEQFLKILPFWPSTLMCLTTDECVIDQRRSIVFVQDGGFNFLICYHCISIFFASSLTLFLLVHGRVYTNSSLTSKSIQLPEESRYSRRLTNYHEELSCLCVNFSQVTYGPCDHTEAVCYQRQDVYSVQSLVVFRIT